MRFQFSIRSLLLLSVVAGIVAMFARWRAETMTSKEIVSELNRAGAEAYVVNHWSGDEDLESPVQVAHLESTLACTGLRIKKVDSCNTLIAASQVKTAQKLTIWQLAKGVAAPECDFAHLRQLHIGDASNQQVRQWVAAAPHLDHLSIAAREELTPETFASIAQIRWINSLRLSDTSVSAEHIAALGRLPALRFLGFSSCDLGPGVYDRLGEFPVLSSLQLYGPDYDNASLDELQHQTQVTSLDLSFSLIDDDGIAILRRWKHLRELELYGCPRISPACVPDLIQMQFLDDLNVLRTEVEKDEKLNRAMGLRLQQWIL